jgi:hypothetical protein
MINFILLGVGLTVWSHLIFFTIQNLKRARLCLRTQAEIEAIKNK